MDSIQISNMAIGLVGGTRITSFSDQSVEAEQCGLYYDVARRFCLESRDWTFAAVTQQLSKDVTPVSSEFAASYALPANCLVVRAVASDAKLQMAEEYQRQGNRIITDAGVIYVKYTSDVTESAMFPSGFGIAVAHKLAEFLASTLTGDKNLKRTLMQESEYMVQESGATDGMQGSPKQAFASRLLRARYGGRGNYGLGKYV